MKRILPSVVTIALTLVAACLPPARGSSSSRLTERQFAELMGRVATGWNQGNARLASDCFSEDAIYSSPPGAKVRRGRAELFEFFGGEKGRAAPMHMEWHHLAYDAESEIGFGEYTFGYRKYQAHGVVVVRVRNGEIQNWREYEIASRLPYERFVGSNGF